ncbi:MAG: DUF459 domain-containing protein [Candidatus Paceibacterota bacterium]|jgi:hypothetical protein
MNPINKIIILLVALAIIIPVANAEKLLRWLPPYGANASNVFQSSGADMARLALTLDPNKTDQASVAQTDGQKEIADGQETPQSKKFEPPAKPYRFLIVGDSLVAVAGGFGDIIEQKLVAFSETAVLRKGKVSSGLSRPDYFDWNKEAETAILSFNPNIAIVMMGTNDAQSFEIMRDGKKQAIAYGTSQWDEEYLLRAKSFINKFTNRGIILYWIGLPAMRDPAYAERIKHVSELQNNAVQLDTMAKFISAEKLMSAGGNAYQPFMADQQGIMRATRNPDGIHLSYFGGTILVEKILNELKKDISLIYAEPESASESETQNPQ